MKTRIPPLVILTGISLITPAFAVVNIDYAAVGDAGNAADAATGSVYGAVAYAYQIARNETTIGQYAEFLNAVAKTDSYGLYSPSMTTSYISGISQSGSSGSFTYSVTLGSADKPVTYVSWFDAARFCNWLQNGQQTGPEAAITAESGAYALNGATSGIITKSVTATVWIPSENEWYKAAYYDPNKGGVGGYWAQATRSDTLAGNTPGVANSANFNDGDYASYTGGSSWGITDVGAYGLNSASAYGTNDQAGNVSEWNDAISGTSRGLRGGSWANTNTPGFLNLDSSVSSSGGPDSEGYRIGFRVASAVPEPTPLVLTFMAGGAMLSRRKR
jgi:formylglycine-generating enzyme required for sulfatase activity